MSCVTKITGTTRTKFFTQYRIINILTELGNEFDKADSKSKKKRSVVELAHLQDFMDAIKHRPSKW